MTAGTPAALPQEAAGKQDTHPASDGDIHWNETERAAGQTLRGGFCGQRR